MPEEQTQAAEVSSPTPAGETPATNPAVDYSKMLDEIPGDILTRHPRFKGYAGEIGQRLAQQQQQQWQQEADARAAKETEERLIREAEENPIAFTNKWLTGKAKERADLEFRDLKTSMQRQMFERIGQSYGVLPEWKQLTQEEFAQITAAVAGRSDEELVPAFNAKAIDLIAGKRSQAQLKRELATQKEAWEREFRASQMAQGDNPSLMGGRNFRINPGNMSDAEFDKWYEQNILRGA